VNKGKSKALLIILDGWGQGLRPQADAIKQAKTPFMDDLILNHPNGQLITFGEAVGLPAGQMGNSEVGHLNIGAGRVVFQDFLRINKAIENDTFKSNVVLQKVLDEAASEDRTVHLIGLLSDGGVHSHQNHLHALIDACQEAGIEKSYIHAFTDGRDTPPKNGVKYVETLLKKTSNTKAKLATVIGRYYAMDRDNRWERIKLAYDLLVSGKGKSTTDFLGDIDKMYEKGITDEFLKPLAFEFGKNQGHITDGDLVLFFNFRTDRCRQLLEAFSQTEFKNHGMHTLDCSFTCMTRYDKSFKNIDVLFEKDNLANTIGEVLSNEGKSQLRIAETEKYPHVTYFLSGGREEPFALEERLVIPSPKVATYDLKPEMSAFEVRDGLLKALDNAPDFICVNFANTDMVGHTGVFDAAVRAAETVDDCVKSICKKALEKKYDILIIADHGNSDCMLHEDGSPHTAHTTNMVPVVYVTQKQGSYRIKNGTLADVAPTLLKLLNIQQPFDMTGENLIYED